MGAERGELTPGAVLGRYVGAFVNALVAAGVDQVCLCPGSRSAPLALTLIRHPQIRVWTHLDERSCAYFALGMAKASRRPVAILCSSGTAAVNFAPAVVEAFHARVPLIVLTADRPPELRDLGANQTIDQRGLYGPAVKWFVEMLLPEASDAALRHARLVAARAVATSLGDAPGPVHLNFPFREPLVPDRLDPTDETPALGPAWAAAAPRDAPSKPSGAWADLANRMTLLELVDYLAYERPRGVIVCGPQDDELLPREVVLLANKLGYAILADPLSQIRCGSHYDDHVIGAYDSFLRDEVCAERLAPAFVLRLGAAPTSKPLTSFLERSGNVTLVSPTATWRDPELTASFVVEADAATFCREVAGALSQWNPELIEESTELPADPLLDEWRRVEETTRDSLASQLASEERVTEPGAIYELADVIPEGAIVFAGNSMPVRDLDSFFPAGRKPVRFLANRGVSGIDGVVSTALGASTAGRGRLVLVVGDLSFYHDMNGLIAARRFGLDATIVLINNDGGGIFSFLPQADDPEHFEALFGTPHGLDFQPAAMMYGLGYHRTETKQDYRSALEHSFVTPGVSLIEVKTDRRENVELHRRVWREVATALQAVGAK